MSQRCHIPWCKVCLSIVTSLATVQSVSQCCCHSAKCFSALPTCHGHCRRATCAALRALADTRIHKTTYWCVRALADTRTHNATYWCVRALADTRTQKHACMHSFACASHEGIRLNCITPRHSMGFGRLLYSLSIVCDLEIARLASELVLHSRETARHTTCLTSELKRHFCPRIVESNQDTDYNMKRNLCMERT